MGAILVIIFIIGILSAFHVGLRAFFRKFFNTEIEFRGKYSRGRSYERNIGIEQIKQNSKYYDELGKIIKERLKLKGIEPTHENIMREYQIIVDQSKKRK